MLDRVLEILEQVLLRELTRNSLSLNSLSDTESHIDASVRLVFSIQYQTKLASNHPKTFSCFNKRNSLFHLCLQSVNFALLMLLMSRIRHHSVLLQFINGINVAQSNLFQMTVKNNHYFSGAKKSTDELKKCKYEPFDMSVICNMEYEYPPGILFSVCPNMRVNNQSDYFTFRSDNRVTIF